MKKGFTLTELLVVIVTIGILTGIAVINVSGITDSAKITAVKADLANFCKMNYKYYTENFDFADTIEDSGFVPSNNYATYNYNSSISCSNGARGFKVEAASNDFSGKVVLNGCNCTLDVSYTASYDDFIAGNYSSKSTFDLSGCESGQYSSDSDLCIGNTVSTRKSSFEIGNVDNDISIDNVSKVEKVDSLKVDSVNSLKDFTNLKEVKHLYLARNDDNTGNFLSLSNKDIEVLNNLEKIPETISVGLAAFSKNRLNSESKICKNFNSIDVYTKTTFGKNRLQYYQVCN